MLSYLIYKIQIYDTFKKGVSIQGIFLKLGFLSPVAHHLFERFEIFFKIYKIDIAAFLKIWNRDQYHSEKLIFVMIRCLLFCKDPPENKVNTNNECNSNSDRKLL